MIYAAIHVANGITNFRYRIREGRVVLHDKLHPSFTDMIQGDEFFKLVTVELNDNLLEFVKYAAAKSKNQKDYFSYEEHVGRDDLIYFTCIPWVVFTHLSHTIKLNKDDSVPRISWGKYFLENDKVLLPFSVQANH